MPEAIQERPRRVYRQASRRDAVRQTQARPRRSGGAGAARAAERGSRMNDPDNFLSRWSRRKSGQRREAEADEQREVVPAACGRRVRAGGSSETRAAEEPGRRGACDFRSREPAIDRIRSPPTPTSAPFLQPGVPADLRNAALRRAWSVDPAIRDLQGAAGKRLELQRPERHSRLRSAQSESRRGKDGGGAVRRAGQRNRRRQTADAPETKASTDISADNELRALRCQRLTAWNQCERRPICAARKRYCNAR